MTRAQIVASITVGISAGVHDEKTRAMLAELAEAAIEAAYVLGKIDGGRELMARIHAPAEVSP